MVTANAVPTSTATWQLDPVHSSVEFSVKHMMMTTVRGRFKEVSATLTADEEHPEGCCVEVVLQAASLDTGVPDRDAHLRSADFFDAERHPQITFKSKHLEGNFAKEGDQFRMVGDLTIRDTTMEVTLECEFAGRGQDPWGHERAGFTAHGEIDRRDWGLRWNQMIETGGVLVANRVRLEAEVQFVRQTG
jgi:polyisoprenoid-binding protein YceI